MNGEQEQRFYASGEDTAATPEPPVTREWLDQNIPRDGNRLDRALTMDDLHESGQEGPPR